MKYANILINSHHKRIVVIPLNFQLGTLAIQFSVVDILKSEVQ